MGKLKEDIIYLAGFFDADGCITTSGNSGFRLTISNTNLNILNWCKKRFGGNINNQFLPKNPNHSPAWKWIISKRKELLIVLVRIYPFLIIKKKQVGIVIKYLEKHPATWKQKNKKKEMKDFNVAKEKVRQLKTDKHYYRGGGEHS